MVRMKIICVSVMRVLTVKPVCIYIYVYIYTHYIIAQWLDAARGAATKKKKKEEDVSLMQREHDVPF